MAVVSSARVNISVKAYQVIQDGIEAGVIPADFLESITLRNGTDEGEIDLVYAVTESAVAASATTSYDLNNLTHLGEAVVFDEVVLIVLRNKRTTALASLQAGPNTSDGFGAGAVGFWASQPDRSVVNPDSWVILYSKAGVIVDATHKVLDIDTSAVVGATNSWDLLVLGRSA